MTVKKRSFVRLISFLLSVVITLSIMLTISTRRAAGYAHEARTYRMRSLSELCEYTRPLPDELRLLACSPSGESTTELAEKVMQNCACAKLCLADFLQESSDFSDIFKFFSEAYDAAGSAADGADGGAKEHLIRLADSAEEICSRFNAMAIASLDEKDDPDGQDDIGIQLYSGSIENLAAAPSRRKESESVRKSGISDSEFLASLPAVTLSEAMAIAAKLIGIEPVLLRQMGGESDPYLYKFYYKNSFVSVTRRGGLICCFYTPCEPAQSFLPETDAAERARTQLEALGYSDLYMLESKTQNNICTVTFAYEDDCGICYTDKITVKVALDSGKIAGLDASGYLFNHKNRTAPNDIIPLKEAVNSVFPAEVLSADTAFIQKNGQELYCYRLLCRYGGQDFLCFFNAVSGECESAVLH